jgi:hypothetical protein
MTKIANGQVSSLGRASSGWRLDLRYFNFGLLGLIAVLGVVYLANISDLTVQGFVLRDLKSQVASIASEKMENEEAVNSAQSYYALNARSKNLNMVAIGNIEYLTNSGVAVAKK